MHATHYRFQFDAQGRVLQAGLYRKGDLKPEETRVIVPPASEGASPREAVVPRAFPPGAKAAEQHARQLVDAQGGFD